MTRRFVLFLALVMSTALPASAQTVGPAGRVEAGGGISWLGQASLGSADANETTPAGSTLRLFSTSTTLGGAPEIDGRIGIRVGRRLEVEAFASNARATLSSTVSNDFENSSTVTATETITQYVLGGGVLWYTASRRAPTTRLSPFVSAGVGYLRQLHESRTLAVTGQQFSVGGGVKYFLASGARRGYRGFGLRGDVDLVARRKGIFGDEVKFSPAVGASVFIRY